MDNTPITSGTPAPAPINTPIQTVPNAGQQNVYNKPTKIKNSTIIIIVLSIATFCGILFGIIGMVMAAQKSATIESLQKQVNELSSKPTTPSSNEDTTSEVYGYWLTSGGTYFKFADNEFYWWKSKNDLTDNYYSGTLDVLQGNNAVEALGTTYDKVVQVITNSKGTVGLDDIYALKLHPTYLISGGIDKTENLATNFPAGNDYMLLSFIITDEGKAQAHNYSTGDTYYLTKTTNQD